MAAHRIDDGGCVTCPRHGKPCGHPPGTSTVEGTVCASGSWKAAVDLASSQGDGKGAQCDTRAASADSREICLGKHAPNVKQLCEFEHAITDVLSKYVVFFKNGGRSIQ